MIGLYSISYFPPQFPGNQQDHTSLRNSFLVVSTRPLKIFKLHLNHTEILPFLFPLPLEGFTIPSQDSDSKYLFSA